MESTGRQAWNTPLSHGEPEELLLEFPESVVQVPADPDKELSETCAEREECSLPLRPQEDGTERSTSTREDTLVASALAASACTPLVLARGHKVADVPELPLVVENLNVESTKTLLKTLNKFGAGEDLKRSRQSKRVRIGHGKVRNSRYQLRRGPLIVYGNDNNLVKRTARNLPGVETVNVYRINLLQLAPGGHLGRFVIWTKDAFKALNEIFGNYRAKGVQKGGYTLNRNLMNCADLARIINSDSVQAKLRDVRTSTVAHDLKKKNPLNNKALMKRLNPFDATRRANEQKDKAERTKKNAANAKTLKKTTHKARLERRKKFVALQDSLQTAFNVAEAKWTKEENVNALVYVSESKKTTMSLL